MYSQQQYEGHKYAYPQSYPGNNLAQSAPNNPTAEGPPQQSKPVPWGMDRFRRPPCSDKIKAGFVVGFCIGMASGAIFRGYSAFRYGLRGQELINDVGKVMIKRGLSYGSFSALIASNRCH